MRSDKPTLFSEINKPIHLMVTPTSPGLKDENDVTQMIKGRKNNRPHHRNRDKQHQINQQQAVGRTWLLLHEKQFGS